MKRYSLDMIPHLSTVPQSLAANSSIMGFHCLMKFMTTCSIKVKGHDREAEAEEEGSNYFTYIDILYWAFWIPDRSDLSVMQVLHVVSLLCACVALAGGQPNATLSIISVIPCSGTIPETVSLYKSDIYTVENNLTFCKLGGSWNPNATNVNYIIYNLTFWGT